MSKPPQRQYVLDSGALIALERRSQKMSALLVTASTHSMELIVPTTVITQVWRDGSRQALLAKALRSPGFVITAVNDSFARKAGELLGKTATTDVVDAHVAVLARELNSPVITSDPNDMRRLDEQLTLITI